MQPTVTLREAAHALTEPQACSGPAVRLREAVDAQLRRAAICGPDGARVRQDVAVALLGAAGVDDEWTLSSACAWIAVVARNKAVDHLRRDVQLRARRR